MVTQSLVFDTIQAHPARVDTLTDPESKPGPCSRLLGEIANVQAPNCVTEKACPAIVMNPVRAKPVELEDTV